MIKKVVLSECMEEAEKYVAILKTLDEVEASYWQAVLCEVRGDPLEGFRLATILLEQTRKWVLSIAPSQQLCILECTNDKIYSASDFLL